MAPELLVNKCRLLDRFVAALGRQAPHDATLAGLPLANRLTRITPLSIAVAIPEEEAEGRHSVLFGHVMKMFDLCQLTRPYAILHN